MGRFFKKFSAQCHKIAVLTASYSEGTISYYLEKFPRRVAKTPFPLPRIVRKISSLYEQKSEKTIRKGCKNAFPTASYSEGINSSKTI